MSDLETALRRAIGAGELVLHYQPIVRVETGATHGFEALVRWERPGFGLVPPGDFIPVAETSDLICEVDAWVLAEAAAQLAVWNRAVDSRHLIVSVNVSGRHVNADRIRDDVATALERSDIDPAQLVLEVTETVPVDEPAIENLIAVRGMGVTLALDDFGVGHSSREQLSRLPVDIAKIDRSYLASSTQTSTESFRSMVQAAHDLGLTVVAEGVEHLDQLDLLRSVGVAFAQGFALGRPAVPTAYASGLGDSSGSADDRD